MKFFRVTLQRLRLQFDEYAADFLYVVVVSDQVFVAQEIAKAELCGFPLGLGAGMKRPVLGAQLLG